MSVQYPVLPGIHAMWSEQLVRLRAQLSARGNQSAKISKGILRETAVLKNNVAQYHFDFSKKVNSADFIVADNDSFSAFFAGVFLTRIVKARPAAHSLVSWPDPRIFSDTANFTLADLEAIYNGSLTITKNNVVDHAQIPLAEFRVQQGLHDGRDASVVNTIPDPDVLLPSAATLTQSTPSALQGAYFPLTPVVNLNGRSTSRDFVIEIDPTGLDIEESASTHDNALVLVLAGYRVVGANIE